MTNEKPPLLHSVRIPLLAAAALYRFIDLGAGEMQQWDEALYALRAVAATRFGEFLDQSAHLFGFYYSAHPPLYVWLADLSTIFFGEHLWVFRLPSALAGAASVYLLYRIGRLASSEFAALAAALFFAFQPLVTFYSRQGQLDLLLTAFMLAYILLFFNHRRYGGPFLALLGMLALAAALYTKFLFALGLPAAIFLWSFFPGRSAGADRAAEGTESGTAPERKRARLFSLATAAGALLLAAPWFVAMTVQHGGGDPFFLFSRGVPFGATVAGMEGSIKTLGLLFYPNQLVVQLSFLFPFFILSLWLAARRDAPGEMRLLALIILLYLIAISIPGSKFTVYLLPLLGSAILLSFDAMRRVSRAGSRTLFWTALLMAPCGLWSISADWRIRAKAYGSAIAGWRGLAAGDLILLGGILLALAAVWLFLLHLHHRKRLQLLFAPDAVSLALLALGFFTIGAMLFRQPAELRSGAREAVEALQADTTRPVIFVGNGINPALTFYLDGADLGWNGTRRSFRRLQPSEEGAAGTREKIAAYARREGPLLVVVEKDEIAQGIYASYTDVVPSRHEILRDVPRYMVVKVP